MKAVQLRFKGVSAGYGGHPVVTDVNLDVPEGSIVLLVGGNGSGKSTLLKAVVGGAEVQAGSICLSGRDLPCGRRISRGKARVGYLPQGGGIFLKLTVAENFLLLLGRRCAKNREVVDEALEGLFPLVRTKWKVRGAEMSGGERQQIAIALALVTKPDILLLDEPSIGLNPNLVPVILQTIREAKEKLGASVLLVEQRVSSALSIANQVYGLREGRIVLVSPADALVAQPELLRSVFLGGQV